MAIGIQQLIDVAVVIGNRAPDSNRTGQAAAAGQVAHAVAVAVGAGLLQNRFNQGPQAQGGRQGLVGLQGFSDCGQQLFIKLFTSSIKETTIFKLSLNTLVVDCPINSELKETSANKYLPLLMNIC